MNMQAMSVHIPAVASTAAAPAAGASTRRGRCQLGISTSGRIASAKTAFARGTGLRHAAAGGRRQSFASCKVRRLRAPRGEPLHHATSWQTSSIDNGTMATNTHSVISNGFTGSARDGPPQH